jgi:hypothetical protein
MVEYTLLAIPPEKALKSVASERFFRGDLIISYDVRRQYVLISQSMPGIQAAIERIANQTVSLTSLHESARRQHRKGWTGGAWNVVRMDRDAAIEHWNSVRAKFAQRVVAVRRQSAWKFEQLSEQ